ncbi:kinetochore protein Spc25 [Bactrocera dorsalis]|uniref:Kinetochore protein Spc25 n=1 Tax=Bactrocera dorsalis TaxID=27457 RepID=A0A034WPG7_BACDO|nr:kinetochore protein Spc25 [Bactrocera dorsalis]
MLKYDYGKRIKAMINREIGLEKREVSISKLSHKYHENLTDLEDRFHDQNARYDKIKNKIKEETEKCNEIQKTIDDWKKRISEMQNEAQRCVAEAVHNRQQLIQQLDEIHTLKLATNTYINLNALPERIQGVFVQETEVHRSWHPFCFEPLSHTPEEVRQIIWGNSEKAVAYSEAWERLVFRSVREMLLQSTKGS